MVAASLDSIAGLSEAAQEFLTDHSGHGISLAFFAISASMWLSLVSMVGLVKVDIRKESEEKRDSVVKGSYLVSLLRERGADSKASI
jgi:hypothetical protein